MYFTYFVVMIVESGEKVSVRSVRTLTGGCQTIIDTIIKKKKKAVMNDRMMSK